MPIPAGPSSSSPPPLVDLVDYLTRTGGVLDDLEVSEQQLLLAALGDASALVRLEAGVDWIADDGVSVTTPAAVVPVVVAMVQRKLMNPSGLTGETLGDHSWQMANASPDLFLTRAELRTVRRAAGRSGIGSIQMEGDLPVQPSEWCW
ncbi:hypothetical protein [Parafrankia sp. EUN1f]|uniref:hypothetical protein n=1 Tax=Parafrankia sp. EUN1f TaxID=102897 RepID=UPI0001C4532D|nr:hypothetical protein [Parafrankia sp. EUN1f]EFC78731.1 hypothetical protein FrEUN1fDRAFT_8148 [Parafrankia sp. EUN1f]EFC78951.1 hypothetical protein FrEUN1fDRAFT_7934 [Parafrankia sp. EUN1f]